MQSLKNNFEKVILGVLLAAFVGSGVYWLVYLGNVRKVASSGDLVTLSDKPKPLKPLTDDDFTAEAKLVKPGVIWGMLDGRPTGDLFTGRDYMRCKNPECLYWVALVIDTCPHCGTDQGPDDTVTEPPEIDLDRDGIPTEVEMAYEFLNPGRRRDAYLDPDEDWFTNVEEYTYFKNQQPEGQKYDGAAMADASVHPPLATRLRLVGIDRDVFGIMLANVMAVKGQPKEDWDISLRVREEDKMRTRFMKMGETIKGYGYKIIDVEEKYEKVYDQNVKDWVRKDVSTVTIQKGNEEPMVLKKGEKTYVGVVVNMVLEISPTKVRRIRGVRANETLRLTDATDQVETYLIEADETRIKATLIGKDGQKGPEFEIDRNPTIDRPDDMFEPMEMEGGMGMPFPGMERYPPVDMMYNRNVRPRQ